MSFLIIILQQVPEVPDAGKKLVEEVTRQDPLLGAVVGVLLLVIVILALQYYREIRRKDKSIESLSSKLDNRTDFIINHVQTSVGIIDNLTRMVEVMSATMDEHHGEVRSDLRSILLDLRTHVSVLQNLPHLAKATEVINARTREGRRTSREEEDFEKKFEESRNRLGKKEEGGGGGRSN